MKIKKIVIKNVRGISTREIETNIHPNTPTFFVAPNGVGKTSIATAFNSINRNRMDVTDENKHLNDIDLSTFLEITDESGTYAANETTNTISSHYAVFVINGQVKPKASTRNFGGYTSSTSSLVIDPIILYNTIPNKNEFIYSLSNMKATLGSSVGKLLINLNAYISVPRVVLNLALLKNDFEKLIKPRNKSKIDSIISMFNRTTGTALEIAHKKLDLSSVTDLEPFNNIITELNFIFLDKTINEKVANTIQFVELYQSNRSKVTNIFNYYKFLNDKDEVNEMLSFFNCTWKNIKASKKRNKFLIEFPKANHISNGERDILCFIGKLFEAKSKLTKDKNILIIDEIFDYLDDANLIASQYFITKFIRQFKSEGRELFPIILTHLDPMYFNTYSFSAKNVVYLEKALQITNKYKINNMLKDRDSCKKNNKNIYDIISSSYLHYSINAQSASPYLESLGVEEAIRLPNDFKLKAYEELEAYKSGNNYDLALVCCGLRLKIEEKAFMQLSPEHKTAFMGIFKTIEKLVFAKANGATVPEVHFLLSIIYNEALHLDPQCQKLDPISYKLKNKVISHMIREV